MVDQEEILETSELKFEGDFDAQVENLLSEVRLSRDEVEGLQILFQDLERTLHKWWPGCQVHPFGSIITGLGIKTSDVDCYISQVPKNLKQVNKKTKFLVYSAKKLLAMRPDLFTNLFAIPMAKVPILKCFHIPTQRQCDLSFKSFSGVLNSRLVAYLLHVDDRALKLAIVIKYWSKVHNLTGTNKMPNYALTLLVIFYLQQKGIISVVVDLQRYVPEYFEDNWNSAFDETFQPFFSDNNDSLYELLGGFFEYYSSFDFSKYVISPFIGSPIEKEKFNSVETVPEEFELYKENLRNGLCGPLKIDVRMCIQDTINHSRNCAVAVFPSLADKIILHFRHVAKMYEDNSESHFLKAVFSQLPQSVEVSTKTKNVYEVVLPINKNTNEKNRRKKKRKMQNAIKTLYQMSKK